ncbi:hypothetical protein [Burkholderia thailandensis]|uniref:hypothetical protein n=1 Tax=Burkholderia thailandensis TaxID=57975 RepID=UPI0013922E11|nr:hypothetical protein [Burkholderia thailandensis]
MSIASSLARAALFAASVTFAASSASVAAQRASLASSMPSPMSPAASLRLLTN